MRIQGKKVWIAGQFMAAQLEIAGLAAKCLCFLACKYTIHLTTWQHFHKSI